MHFSARTFYRLGIRQTVKGLKRRKKRKKALIFAWAWAASHNTDINKNMKIALKCCNALINEKRNIFSHDKLLV